jgi:AmpD protein
MAGWLARGGSSRPIATSAPRVRWCHWSLSMPSACRRRSLAATASCELFTNRLDPAADTYFAQISHLRVSAHFLIRRDGELIQFVSCRERAWHAGLSSWQGRPRCNDFSLGIELEGCDDLPFEPPQYGCLVDLLRRLCASYPIAAVVGHSDISPGRKTDPGLRFDWHRLAAFGKLPGVLC